MSSRGTRIAVLVVALAAIAAAGYRLVVLQHQRSATATAADVMRARTDAFLFTLQELRAAQQAYVAAGQNEQVWTGRVSALWPEAGDRLREIQHTASAAGGVSRPADAAATALATFGKTDIRAREYLRDGQPLMASDLIFSEAREALSTVATAVDQIRRANAADTAVVVQGIERQQILTCAAGAAVLLFLIIGQCASRERVADVPATVTIAPAAPPALTSAERMMLDQPFTLDGPLALATPTATLDDGTATRALPTADTGLGERALADLAQVCTDLARLADGTQLGAVLARAASLTGATGLILWVADRTGQVLHPVAAHGYDAKVLARLGSIPRTAENATAAAYRLAQVHTVPGDGTHNGALVVPLPGPEGCSGVLTAEVASGNERREAVRAIATVVAAQLATLVTALPATDSAPQG